VWMMRVFSKFSIGATIIYIYRLVLMIFEKNLEKNWIFYFLGHKLNTVYFNFY
jgi:hypothetical protein